VPGLGLSDRDLVALHVESIVLRPRHIEVTIRDPDPASHQLAEANNHSRADRQDEKPDGRQQFPTLLTIPWVPVGAMARKGIAFEPAGGQNLDPIARDTLLTAIARARCWMDDLVEGQRELLRGDRQKRGQG
jgi:site-specific DNA recombinase